MSPERFIDPSASRRTSFLVSMALTVMTVGVIFLTGIVVYALIVGDPQEEKLSADVERIILQQEDARYANACTGYQNHRAIEQALRDIARLNGIRSGEPRVLPSEETVKSCRKVGIEIDENGVPVLPGNH